MVEAMLLASQHIFGETPQHTPAIQLVLKRARMSCERVIEIFCKEFRVSHSIVHTHLRLMQT